MKSMFINKYLISIEKLKYIFNNIKYCLININTVSFQKLIITLL